MRAVAGPLRLVWYRLVMWSMRHSPKIWWASLKSANSVLAKVVIKLPLNSACCPVLQGLVFVPRTASCSSS